MRRGRGVTPPSVERSFGLQYYPTCLASSSRVKTCRGRRGARQADKAGGSLTPAVRHWLRFCVFGRHVSPMRDTDVSDPLAAKVADEAFLMDFALWLVLSKPSGRSISVNTAAKYISTVKAWHLRRFHRRIGADLELAGLKDMLKAQGHAPRARRPSEKGEVWHAHAGPCQGNGNRVRASGARRRKRHRAS